MLADGVGSCEELVGEGLVNDDDGVRAGSVFVGCEATAFEQRCLHGGEIAGGDGALFDKLVVLVGVAADPEHGKAFGVGEWQEVDEACGIDALLR
jgi:hypothetical protein